MVLFDVVLILATFLCSLVAGFLFAFAIVAMPGMSNLNDREFIRAFQVMDRVIQQNQPLFMLVWIGSAIALVTAAVLGIGRLAGMDLLLLLAATLAYLLGVQVPTIAINIPLNNKLQTVDVDTANAATREAARKAFEPRWVRWNAFRTVFASVVSVLLIILVFSL